MNLTRRNKEKQILCILLSLIFVISGLFSWNIDAKAEIIRTGTVEGASSLNFRSGPGTTYPSIGYFGIKTLKDWSYNRLESLEILGNAIEYSWFDINKFMVLANTINTKYTSVLKNSRRKTLDEIVYEEIARFYNITDDKLIKYIKGLYTYKNNWDYISDSNINDYVYNISLVLK
jgi:hypothetical protein